MAAYTTIDNPELYFQVELYTGNGSSGHAQTLDGSEDMQPDIVWIKNRDTTGYHTLFDSVRGVEKPLWPTANSTEGSDSNTLTAFGSDGFTVASDAAVNGNTNKLVAWCWKAGTAFSNDASATSVGSIDSSGSINTTAGISIVNFTGNGTAGATVAHGLSAVPRLILVKVHTSSTAYDWRLYHGSLGATKNMIFNDDSAVATATNKWNDTAPTSSVFSLGDTSGTNESGSGIIAYSFAEKQGFSKFGIYTGNNNADGPFVYTGFRPAWTILKRTDSTDNWILQDNERKVPFNAVDSQLFPDLENSESSSSTILDYCSNGFKIRKTGGNINASGGTYIYLAFAEAPFVNSNKVPGNAR